MIHKLEIETRTCCEECNEISFTAMDCPKCGEYMEQAHKPGEIWLYEEIFENMRKDPFEFTCPDCHLRLRCLDPVDDRFAWCEMDWEEVPAQLQSKSGSVYDVGNWFDITDRGRVFTGSFIPNDFPLNSTCYLNGEERCVVGIESFAICKDAEWYKLPQKIGLLLKPLTRGWSMY